MEERWRGGGELAVGGAGWRRWWCRLRRVQRLGEMELGVRERREVDGVCSGWAVEVRCWCARVSGDVW